MIGVLGASGAVGRHAAALLAGHGIGTGATDGLRLGARRPDAVPVPPGCVAGSGTGGVEVVGVDARDPASLAAFCRGLDLVLTCAGPSYALRDTVAAAALAAGADCVDVGGDDPAHEALHGRVPAGRTVLLSAGTVPGLSVLLPRWLAADGLPAHRMTGCAGGLERCSPTVAADILLSLQVGGAGGEPFGHPLAARRDGTRQARVLRVVEDADHPHYPEPVTLQPLLTAEVERVAERLGIPDADWYNAYPGAQVRALFARLPVLAVETAAQRAEVERRMVTASEVDLAGRSPYYRMVVELEGADGTRVGVVRAPDSYRITATVAVHAARAIRAGTIPAGLHFAGDVLDPDAVVADLTGAGIADIARFDGALAVEDGVL